MSTNGNGYITLERLARLNSQDQLEHGYIPLYEALFEPIRFDYLNILEIGFSRGRGARTLAEYFHRSKVHSLELDYDQALPYYENFPATLKERVKLYHCDQGDARQLQDFTRGKHTSNFNLIIDDGSHNPEHQMTSYQCLWSTLAPGGYYVIEDMHPYYNKGQHPTLTYFMNKVHEINKNGKIKEAIPTPDIAWIMFPNNRVVLRKKS